ncbi:S41 family peptidase [Polaribacter gangjinensis]|uniref:S41 family peptidase n=1 Tax=Polaribacter gangjinensis TaxID=574710 RepID=UPI00293D2C79|nr:S41 family peptidase [Polaribacter gangjinensis]
MILILIGAISLSFSFKSNFFEIAKQIEIYNTLFKELNMYYVDEINPAELTEKAIKNTLNSLDPYTNFYNEQMVENAKIAREGEYGGVGVNVFYTKEGIHIREIYKGFSADKAGLKPGDIIVSVGNQSLKNMNVDQQSEFLKGVPNSKVLVEIERQGKKIQKELTREKVVLNPVPFSEMIDSETGYIVLTEFNEKASFEVKKAFKDLQQKGMKKLVFDLRSNPGGSLLEAINITNFFIPKGKTIVSTKAKVKSLSTVYRASNDPLDLQIPIVVLINRRSASASEIVIGALQDYDRAVIMGQRSFGKGLVQRYRELTYGTQLKVTISKYYTPSGRCIQELDYTNRDPKTGEVPKFSDRGIQAFKTENGRTVYDGGGVTPDIVLETSKRLPITETLLDSKAIFNFGVAYLYKNPKMESFENFRFTNADFKEFTNFLAIDTTFVTKQEKLFQDAFEASKNADINKEHQKIKEKLVQDKISEVAKNEDIITEIIKEEILKNYFYEEGWFQYQLKNDQTILKATQLLKNSKSYTQILSSK